MKTVILDIRCIESVAALHIYLQYALKLPEHYGRNLDALHDALGEIGQDTRIWLCRSPRPGGEMAAYLPRLTRVLEDAARENAHLEIRLEEGGADALK